MFEKSNEIPASENISIHDTPVVSDSDREHADTTFKSFLSEFFSAPDDQLRVDESKDGETIDSFSQLLTKLQDGLQHDSDGDSREDFPHAAQSAIKEYSIDSKNEQPDNSDSTEGQTDYPPNSTVKIDGRKYETDDNGQVYMQDGKLLPNSTYELNGNVYKTDDHGRIISCEAYPSRSPENARDNDAQKEAGGNDRRDGDQGGHIVSRDLNGDSGAGNLVAMDSRINQSDYKRMEGEIKKALDEGKEVTTKTEIEYDGDSERPSRIKVTVTVDGKDTVYYFDNDIDGSLMDEVPENGKETVETSLEMTGGEISSVKKEYDEDGNLEKTTVTVTYSDEDGNNRRYNVVIYPEQGETSNE